MKRTHFFLGIISLVAAGLLWLVDLTRWETSLGETFLAKVSIYPAAFFGLLGLVLIYWSLKPLLGGGKHK
ncbi:hypothetical protein ACFLXB_08685 [Chloroflexota bacterium]